VFKSTGLDPIIAGTLLMKQQLLITRRRQLRSRRLTPLDLFLLGFWSLYLNSRQIVRAAVIVRPSTLLKFHALLKKRKYRLLYSSNKKGKPGPKGPSKDIIEVVIALKRGNPGFGFLRISQQISNTFGTAINNDVVRRISNDHGTSDNEGNSASWLSLLVHTKDSLWSTDLFLCKSIQLQTHWVLVVMNQYTRRIIGFGIQSGDVDGVTLCCMFNCAISKQDVPWYLSTDYDPLFRYHRWQANLRILEVAEIKSIPYTPTSHTFIERLIGMILRECFDRLFFCNTQALERKLESFAQYYNQHRLHQSLDGKSPVSANDIVYSQRKNLAQYAWMSHYHGLFKTQIAA